MPKVKTHSSSKKRFKITAKGKVKMSHAYRRHRLISKSRKAKKNTGSELMLLLPMQLRSKDLYRISRKEEGHYV